MKVGVYFDLRNPTQWRRDPSWLYGFTLEACREAERLGAPSVWFSEHHLFDDDYLSSPLTFAAAVAARTSTIRLGTAIVIAPLHNPAELAEQAATVDLISGGRLDLGVGAGYRVPEFELFGVPMAAKYKRTDDTVRELRRLWGPGGVRPGPVQDRLPIWLGYQGPQGAARAGRLGERLLSPDPSLWEPYRQGLAEAGLPESAGVMSGGFSAWATDDPEHDWPIFSEHLAYQLNSYRRHMVEGTGRPEPRPVDLAKVVNATDMAPLQSYAFGTPEFVAQRIREDTTGAPVDTVFLWASIGGMSEDMVMRNIENICNRLAPLLADD